MSTDQIIQVVMSLGVPTACLIILGKWTAQLIEKSHAECLARETSMRGTIDKLDTDLRSLEREVRHTHSERLAENSRVMGAFVMMMENFTGVKNEDKSGLRPAGD